MTCWPARRPSIIIHAGADNFGNIPADRYNQVNGAPGSRPDDDVHRRRRQAGGVRCHRRRLVSPDRGYRISVDFASSPRPTLGVEWEFALVDAQTRDLSNEATAVFAEIGENPRVHKELLRNTVEVVSGICDCTAQAMDDLRATLSAVRRSSGSRGMELFGAGTHPFAQWSAQKLTDAPRYAELIKRTQWWGRQMLIWGVHVHVGISSPDKVMPIMSSLLN